MFTPIRKDGQAAATRDGAARRRRLKAEVPVSGRAAAPSGAAQRPGYRAELGQAWSVPGVRRTRASAELGLRAVKAWRLMTFGMKRPYHRGEIKQPLAA
jgi:hypothetical protein